jgi:hypothetical protein
MTRSTVSFCGSDSRGAICHLLLTCLDPIKLGSDEAVPGALNASAGGATDARVGTDLVCAG